MQRPPQHVRKETSCIRDCSAHSSLGRDRTNSPDYLRLVPHSDSTPQVYRLACRLELFVAGWKAQPAVGADASRERSGSIHGTNQALSHLENDHPAPRPSNVRQFARTLLPMLL